MLTRIGLIVAIVAGLAVAGINFVKVKDNISTLRTNLSSETSAKETAQADAATSKKNETAAKKELESTKTDLADTQQQRDKAVAEADSQTKRASKLSDDLAKTQLERNDAQEKLAAWSVLGLTADQVKPMLADLKATKQQLDRIQVTNQLLTAKINTLKNRLYKYEPEEGARVELPADLAGKVLVADPKWDFVVLNVGAKQGVLEEGVMLVNRNGRLVAKVQIRNVQPDRSVANVLPNWKLADVMEGDEVIP